MKRIIFGFFILKLFVLIPFTYATGPAVGDIVSVAYVSNMAALGGYWNHYYLALYPLEPPQSRKIDGISAYCGGNMINSLVIPYLPAFVLWGDNSSVGYYYQTGSETFTYIRYLTTPTNEAPTWPPPPCQGDSCYSAAPQDIEIGAPDNTCPDKLPNFVGNPINILNGNKYESVTDLILPSPNKKGIAFQRYYNSKATAADILGHGWTHSYSVKLTTNVILDGITHIRIEDNTGKGHYFKYGSGSRWDGVFKDKSYVIVENDGTYTWHTLDGTKYGFNSLGKLSWMDDVVGNRQSFSYDGNNRLETMTDAASSRILRFHYNADSLLDYIEGPVTAAVTNGVWVSYGYDANHNLISVTYADGSGLIYDYTDPNNNHNLTVKKDKLGQILATWSYDIQDWAYASTTRDGRGVNINYVDADTVEVTNAYGVTKTYGVTKLAGLYPKVTTITGPGSCQTCAGDQPIRYAYDENLNVIEEEYANAAINRFTNYDDRGNPGTAILAVGSSEERTITYTYHPSLNQLLTRTESSVLSTGNKVTVWDYDDDGNTVPNQAPTPLVHRKVELGFTKDSQGTVEPYEQITTYQYNAKGQVVSIDGPLPGTQDLTSFVYAPTTGDLTSITLPIVGETSFQNYDGAGNPGQMTDYNGQFTTYTYDGRNRLLSSTQNGITSARSFNAAGEVATIINPGNGTFSFAYYQTGLLKSITDMTGAYHLYGYDSQGNHIKDEAYDHTGALKRQLRFDYQNPSDPGRLWRIIQPDDTATIYDYDAVGNLKSVIDAKGNVTTYGYDALNRMREMIQPGAVTTGFAYDTQGNLKKVTDPGAETTAYEYDDMGRILTVTSPDTGCSRYVYDVANNRITKTDAKGVNSISQYDPLGRLTAISYPQPEEDINLTYDQGENAKGRLTGVTDASAATAYGYDAFGRLVSENRTIKGKHFTTAYGYDNANRLAAITYPSGRLVSYQYDEVGEIAAVTTTYNNRTETVADAFTYLPFGPMTAMRLASGQTVTNAFDQLYRLTNSQTGLVYNRTYDYDVISNITAITDQVHPAASQSFSYDALSRLHSATGPYGALSYTFDPVGNRLTQTSAGQTTTYDYLPGTNLLQTITDTAPTTLTYDSNGNLKTKGDMSFTYDQNNRLIAAARNGAGVGEYTYNSDGQRAIKSANGQTIINIYDQDGNLLSELDETGATLVEYAYANGRLLSMFNYQTTNPGEVEVTVSADKGRMLAGVNVYVFDEQNHYTGKNGVTDSEGRVVFQAAYFSDGYYKFRADYLGDQFWSALIPIPGDGNAEVTINEEQSAVTVTMANGPVAGVKVFLFDEAGRYLGIYQVTDASGQVFFDLPVGQGYKFRTDYLGSQYWSDENSITAGGPNQFAVSTGGGSLTLTVQKGPSQPLAGIKAYLFSASGQYLGENGVTDANGQVAFMVSAGKYQMRGDYLGYNFWSDLGQVTGNTDLTLTIPHQDVAISVVGDYNGSQEAKAGIKTYLYTLAGTYLGESLTNRCQRPGYL